MKTALMFTALLIVSYLCILEFTPSVPVMTPEEHEAVENALVKAMAQAEIQQCHGEKKSSFCIAPSQSNK